VVREKDAVERALLDAGRPSTYRRCAADEGGGSALPPLLWYSNPRRVPADFASDRRCDASTLSRRRKMTLAIDVQVVRMTARRETRCTAMRLRV